MFANFATAIPTGAAVTCLLLFAMQSLIGLQPEFTVDTTDRYDLIFIRNIPDEKTNLEEFPKIKKIEPIQPPPVDHHDNYSPDDTGVSIPNTPAIPKDGYNPVNYSITNNGPLMAIVRVQPQYPAVAVTRGLEGFVVVEFDVMSDGTVSNITVVKSSSSVFERSAMQAASQFRFKARVVDGVPQTSTGVQYQFRFKMDD